MFLAGSVPSLAGLPLTLSTLLPSSRVPEGTGQVLRRHRACSSSPQNQNQVFSENAILE